MGCRSYVASFAESYQIIAEGFVCFCKKRVSDNGKSLIQRWTSQVSIKGCPNSGERFFVVKSSVSPSCGQIKLLQTLFKCVVETKLKNIRCFIVFIVILVLDRFRKQGIVF